VKDYSYYAKGLASLADRVPRSEETDYIKGYMGTNPEDCETKSPRKGPLRLETDSGKEKGGLSMEKNEVE